MGLNRLLNVRFILVPGLDQGWQLVLGLYSTFMHNIIVPHPRANFFDTKPCTSSSSSSIYYIVTRSDQPKPPAVAIVRQNGLSSASCRASVAVTPVSRQIWWIQVCVVNHWHVSTPARAGHHPSSWYRFEGSGLPVHHFEVWRRDQTDPQTLHNSTSRTFFRRIRQRNRGRKLC